MMLKTCLVVALTACSALTSWAGASDEDAIKQTMQSFVQSWNKHDAKAMSENWLENGDAINPAGRVARGRAEVEKLFMDEHSTMMKSSTATMDVTHVNMLADGVALVDMEMKITGMTSPEGKAMPPMPLHVAAVMKKDGGSWKLSNARPYAFVPQHPGHGKHGAKTAKK
jgi:uncharacterized protein (TIGR02246 family)